MQSWPVLIWTGLLVRVFVYISPSGSVAPRSLLKIKSKTEFLLLNHLVLILRKSKCYHSRLLHIIAKLQDHPKFHSKFNFNDPKSAFLKKFLASPINKFDYFQWANHLTVVHAKFKIRTCITLDMYSCQQHKTQSQYSPVNEFWRWKRWQKVVHNDEWVEHSLCYNCVINAAKWHREELKEKQTC